MKKIVFFLIIGLHIVGFAQKPSKLSIKFQIDSSSVDSDNIRAYIIIKNLSYKSIECLLDSEYILFPDGIFRIMENAVNDTLTLPLFHFKLKYGGCIGCDSLSVISYSYTNMNILKLKSKKKYIINIILNKEQLSTAKYFKVTLNFLEGLSYGRPQVETFKFSEMQIENN